MSEGAHPVGLQTFSLDQYTELILAFQILARRCSDMRVCGIFFFFQVTALSQIINPSECERKEVKFIRTSFSSLSSILSVLIITILSH